MKTNIVSATTLLLLSVLLILAVANRIYIESHTATILKMLDEITVINDTSEERIERILNYWKETAKTVSLTFTDNEIKKLDELFDMLRVSYISGNEFEYNKAMAQLKRAIADIGKREKISMDNIF